MFSRSIRDASKRQVKLLRRYNHHDHGHHEPVKETEINLAKVFGIAVLGGVSLIFYKNYKAGNDPIVRTKLYNEVEERPNLRNENYLKRYQTSFIKGYIRDKGGVGQKQYNRMAEGALPVNLIPTHSTDGNQFGSGIKLGELGPRRENIQYFSPLK
ncbi:hypothetical protein PSN45_003832 [Yamadazyma tenuis]|uniref:Uncharacterized protein n=1 Tax=Candida tenuis (strain ATCC 10573 / BCRC 21748 / CBS 615 / JCM 9827 / NBRC 10315 / NRRL Y-1498 / VKM Y-70) TaxID=590646 RepID=G3B342_CANTC|nr:uncharacterized protein CANTEDRAFT_114110 [Yamadazyma tenuis ATCC 10573]EGV64073.1 hypothetical protein CANTEDRAFT_114110 [Yamadazyma tenuis ATCC 10573]WEJ96295.1 hypothetical protein PSN45_003832 [Yamadazyma tenuis]